MNSPCVTCSTKGYDCTYDRARKKRGPVSKRMSEIQLRQKGTSRDDRETPRTVQSPAFSDGRSSYNTEYGIDSWPPRSTSTHEFTAVSPSDYTQVDQTRRVIESGDHENIMASPNAFIFPSLPADSPSGSADQFGSILEQDLPLLTAATDVWPARVNEMTLLPWIDVYFKRLHPTIPILSRTNIYSDMLLRKHRTDPHYGAMLLGLCAFAMTQPVQIHERASMPSRSVQARMLMEECVRMRVSADFGEVPTIETALASFFLFACLFGDSKHNAARHRLREAVDLAYSLRLHLPESYVSLEPEVKEQWLRTYLVLSVTERAYALQQNHAISFRGQPGVTARFMDGFGSVTSEYISSLIYERSDSVGMTGLLYLMDTFDAIDENVMDCWNGYCRFSDGICESFDRRRALQMFRAQRRVREACNSGNISFAPSVTPLPLTQLLETQQADISITQLWLLNRLWNLCLSHQLLLEDSEHIELRFDFACRVARAVLSQCNKFALASMEVHGVGFIEKVHDVSMGIIVAVSSARINLDTAISQMEPEQHDTSQITVRELLDGLGRLIKDFRGGDHPYSARFTTAVEALLIG